MHKQICALALHGFGSYHCVEPMIIHLDADAFYVSCEQAADSRLRGALMAIGGTRRGIIASACYEARKLGVYTPMPSQRALKICPQLRIIRPRFHRYEWFSRAMFSLVGELTPFIERTSIDEGYIQLPDNSDWTAAEAARHLQERIWERLRIPVSMGLASNKLVSQIASKLHKPKGFHIVDPGSEQAFLAPLEVKWLPGVGGKTEPVLKSAGFHHVRDVAEASTSRLAGVVGDWAPTLQAHARGEDERSLRLDRGDSLSYSHQDTFGSDVTDRTRILRVLRSLTDDLVRQLVADGKSARTLTIRIRLRGMQDTTRSESLSEPSSLADDFYPLIERLLDRAWNGRSPVRLASTKLSNIHEGVVAGDLFTREDKSKRLALQQSITDLQRRFGSQSIRKGHDWSRKRGTPPGSRPS